MRDVAVARPRGVARGPKAKARSAKHSRLRASLDPAFRVLRHHPAKSLAVLACAALMSGIAANAVLLQKGRHPAPLFGTATGSVHPAASAPVPQPVPRPTSIAPAAPLADPPPTAAPEPSGPDASDAAPAEHPEPRKAERHPVKPASPVHSSPPKIDGIARLLEGKGAVSEADGASVMAAQKALGKLGYTVEADGRMGTATREALAKFAHDRHLAGDATLSPKLLRALQKAAAPQHAAGTPKG